MEQADLEPEVGAIVRALRAEDDASPAAAQREAGLLEWLVTSYTAQRNFCTPAAAGLPSPDDFRELFRALVAARFANDAWWNQAPEANRLLVLQSLRLLMRDAALQQQWAAEPGATSSFSARLHHYAAGYGASASSEFNLEIVGELAAMAKRLPVREPSVCAVLAELDVPGALVSLLRSSDGGLLHSVIVSLTRLAIEDGNRRTICKLDPVDPLLARLRDGEQNLRMAAAELLLLLARERRTRDDIREANGAALFLSLVSSDVRAMALAALHLLCGLAREPEAGRDIRLLGGIPLLVGHLVRCMISTAAPWGEAQLVENDDDQAGSDEIAEALCVLLGKLALEDESAYQLRQANAVHALGCLALKCAVRCSGASSSSVLRVQALCFRALRTLYTCVRNRRMFDRLLPSALLVAFSEVPLFAENYLMAEFAGGTAGSGVSAAELLPFKVFSSRFNEAMASSTQRAAVEAALHDIDANASARRTIGDYDVLELLGNGAFGTVYKVKHRRLGRMYAMKQLAQGLHGGAQWASTPRRPHTGGRPRTAARIEETQAAAMAQEVAILSQLEHPHIVHYYEQVRCDADGSLAIVMEYVEGASLRERISVALETRTPIPEEETWRILLQITLALRYLHVEMRVIHRDLTPGNVLLQHVPPTTAVSGSDRAGDSGSCVSPSSSFIVKLADFGLATVLESSEQREGTDGERGGAAAGGIGQGQSVVGTMLYACPEIVQSLPYTENADVWSLGCVLYELTSLQAPFAATSLLHVVKRIVECEYEPLLIRGEQSEEELAALAAADEAAFQARLEAASNVSGMSAQIPPPRCLCSAEIANVVAALLVVDPAQRPTMPRVAELLAPRLMSELERVSTTQRALVEEVRAAGEERQRAILEGAIGREARAALRTRARTATAATAANPAAGSPSAANAQRSARMDRLLQGQEQGRSSPFRGGSAAGDVISIPAAALREISDPATELLGTFQQILRVAEQPPITTRERDDKVRRRVLGQYKTFLLENRVSVLKAELTKLTTGSSELIPAAAELSPPKSYAEMLSILQQLTEDLTFYESMVSEGAETLLMAPTTRSSLPTVYSDHIGD